MEEEVFENERFARSATGAAQWSPANLRSGEDPRHFQFMLHEADTFPQVGACALLASFRSFCGGVRPGEDPRHFWLLHFMLHEADTVPQVGACALLVSFDSSCGSGV